MNQSALRKRLERIEGTRSHTRPAGVVRIITESDDDATAELAALTASGRYTPGHLVIDRRIVEPRPRRLDT